MIWVTAAGARSVRGCARLGDHFLNTDRDMHASLIRELAETLDTMASSHSCRTGEVLFRQGQPGDGVLVLRQGKVRLSAGSPGADNRLSYRVVGPGYVLGLPALFTGRPYSLTAEALEECAFGFVDRERALQLIRNRLDLCFQAADLLAQEVRSLREWQAANMGANPK